MITTTAPDVTTTTSQRLRELVDPIWQAQHDHPFVRGIGDGTLDTDKFGFWLRQDYLYLIDYSRVFGYAAIRSPDLETMMRFSELMQVTLTEEMGLHRSYVAEFGITEADLEAEQIAPTTRGYTDFLLRVAATGDFAELVGALLPCTWGYSEVGLTLMARGLPDEERYARWIKLYASPEFAALATWCRNLLDSVCDGLPPAALARVEEAFLASSRYELAFWEMAWRQE